MAEQPYLFGPLWIPIKDGDPSAMSIFKRHYTARKARKIEQFIGPGGKMALITPDAKALFAWREFISDAGETGINCAVFRNEGTELARSSDLIRAAIVEARTRWPFQRLHTYVDPREVRHKRDPGRCFRKAGFTLCRNEDGKPRTTKDGKLIFEIPAIA